MAEVLFPHQKKKRRLTWIIVISIIIIIAVLYYGYGPKNVGTSDDSTDYDTYDTSQPIEDIDKDFLSDKRFSELKDYLTEPINPQNLGRENPFTCY